MTVDSSKGDYFMNAPGKGLLKVVSILFIIFGAIATIISLLGLLGSAALSSMGEEVGAAIGGILMVAMVVALISSVLELILGIIGIKKCGDPSKAGYFIVVGIILVVISFVPLIIGITSGGFIWTSLVSFVLPILYIVGGFMNKKVVA